MRKALASIVLYCTLSIFANGSSAWGQIVHIKPPFNDVPRTGRVLAEIVPGDSAVRVTMTNEKITIGVKDKIRSYDLEGKTIQELEFFVGSQFENGEVQLDVKRPSALLTQIEPFTETRTLRESGNRESKRLLVSRGGEPNVNIGFAGLLALETPGTDTDDNLLESAGFQLDLTGEERIYKTRGKGIASAYATLRVGLGANETLQVAEGDADGESVESQLESALKQADLISLSLQIDQFLSTNPQSDVNFYALGAITYTEPDPFIIPLTISSGGTEVPLTDVFGTDELEKLRNDLDVVRPLLEFGGGPVFRFSRRGEPLFYFGMGIHTRQLLKRGFRFRRDQNQNIVPGSLAPILKENWAGFWKVIGGIRLSNNFDMRFDTATPFDRNRTDALLRIAIARTFPISK
jgi:hypothetical protein